MDEFVLKRGEDEYSHQGDKLNIKTLTRFERRVISQLFDEQERAGQFMRILPDPVVGFLFQGERYLSHLLNLVIEGGYKAEDFGFF